MPMIWNFRLRCYWYRWLHVVGLLSLHILWAGSRCTRGKI